jgi:Flp pilus assembly protein TadG
MRQAKQIRERGSAMVETALVILPLLFCILAILEVGRAISNYHALASAVKRGARMAAVHGARCADASSSCQLSVSDLSAAIQQSAIGLDAAQLQLTFGGDAAPVSCNPVSVCAQNSAAWPASPGNAAGQTVTIQGVYNFKFAVGLLWPGQKTAAVPFFSQSSEIIEF